MRANKYSNQITKNGATFQSLTAKNKIHSVSECSHTITSAYNTNEIKNLHVETVRSANFEFCSQQINRSNKNQLHDMSYLFNHAANKTKIKSNNSAKILTISNLQLSLWDILKNFHHSYF